MKLPDVYRARIRCVNLCLPARVQELIRGYRLGRQGETDKAESAGSSATAGIPQEGQQGFERCEQVRLIRSRAMHRERALMLSQLRAFHQRIVALVNEISDDAELGRRVRRYVQSEREGERRGEDREDEGEAEAERARGP